MKQVKKRSLRISAFVLALVLAAAFAPALIWQKDKTAFATPGQQYKSDYISRAEMRKAALKLNEEIMEEGAVLLKNDNSLPLSKTAKVTILGKNSTNLILSGTGSSGSNTVLGGNVLYNAFKASGIETNPYAEAFYRNHQLSGAGRPDAPTFGNRPSGTPTGETRAVGDMFYGAAKVVSGNARSTAESTWGQKGTAPDADLDYVGGQTDSNYNVDVTAGGATKNLRDSFEEYNDAAVVVFSRAGGEGFDLPRMMKMQKLSAADATGQNYFPNYNVNATTGVVTSARDQYSDNTKTDTTYDDGADTVIIPGARDWDDHYLQLDQNETNILREACAYFDNVIVLINAGTPMELGFLDDQKGPDGKVHYAYNEKIRGCIWMSTPGENATNAIPRLLSGEVNPSGSSPDTFARNFMNDPTLFNFANDNVKNGNRYTLNNADVANREIYFLDYQEDIYLGYRYYETRYAEMLKKEAPEAEGVQPDGTLAIGSADKWYKENVYRPFGYSESFTTFETQIVNYKVDGAYNAGQSYELDGKSEITMSVRVTNTGLAAGKKAVQFYANAPYTPGGIEKADKVFIGFEKTRLLKPGESQVLSAKLPAYYFASFDWDDANKNDFKGYEIEKGEYKIFAADNAHDSSKYISFTVAEDVEIGNDPSTDYPVVPLFDYTGKYMQTNSALLSRQSNFANYGDLTRISTRRETTQEHLDKFCRPSTSTAAVFPNTATAYPFTDAEQAAAGLADLYAKTRAPLIKEPYPTTQTATVIPYEDVNIKFGDMFRVAYDDPLWDAFLDQLTFQQMAMIIGGSGSTPPANSGMAKGGSGLTSNRYFSVQMENIGKPVIMHLDGPVGWSNDSSPGEHAAWDGGTANPVGKMHMTSTSGNSAAPPLAMASTILLASSMNKELQYEVGNILGEDALWGYDHINNSTVSGGYAPAANIHRTPFSGRNFEYYSEDGILSGITMGQVVKGEQNCGVYSFMKHYFLNDQESRRDAQGLATWATEQCMREIYAKAFEIGIKAAVEHNPYLVGLMTGFNRIGYHWNGADYAVITEMPRNEWGMRGHVIADWLTGNYQYTEAGIISGNDKVLGNRAPVVNEFILGDPTYGNSYKWAVRTAVKNILFADVNSNAIVHTTGVRTNPVNPSTQNNNTDNTARTFTVGTPINYNLQTDAAIRMNTTWPVYYRPTVMYGDKDAVTYTYEMAPGWSLPKGLTLTPDGRIIGTPQAPTVNRSASGHWDHNAQAFRITVKATGVNTSYYDGAAYPDAHFDKRGETIVYNEGVQWVALRITGSAATADPYVFGGSMLGTAEFGKPFEASVANVQFTGAYANSLSASYSVKPGYSLPAGFTLSGGGKILGRAEGSDIYTASIPVVAQIIATAAVTVNGTAYNAGDIVGTTDAFFTLQIGKYDDAWIRDWMSGIDDEILAIQDDIDTINGETLDGIRTDISALKGDITTINGSIADLGTIRSNITALQGNISTINSEIATIKGNITTLQGNISTINSSIADLGTIRSNITALQGNISTINGDITAIKGNITTLQGNVTTINDSIADLATIRTNISAIQAGIADLATIRTNISTLQGKVSAIETALGANFDGADVKAKLTSLQNQIAALDTALETDIAGLETALNDAIAGLEDDLDDAMADLEALIVTGDTGLDAQITALETDLDALQKALGDAEKSLAELEKNKQDKSCNNASSAIVALFGLLACALVVIIKKQF